VILKRKNKNKIRYIPKRAFLGHWHNKYDVGPFASLDITFG
jgi:hypothetical protein